MSPREEGSLNSYLEGNEERDPVLTFAPFGFWSLVMDKMTCNEETKVYEISLTDEYEEKNTLRILSGLSTFINDTISGQEQFEEWFTSYFVDDYGQKNKERWENFNRDIILFIQNGAITKPLSDIFPNDAIRRYYLGLMIVSYHQMFEPDCFENPEEEIQKRKKNEFKYGTLVNRHPMEIMKEVNNLCKRVCDNIRGLISEEKPSYEDRAVYIRTLKEGLVDGKLWTLKEIGDKFGITRQRVSQILIDVKREPKSDTKNIKLDSNKQKSIISFTDKEAKSIKYLASRFEPYGFLDSKGKGMKYQKKNSIPKVSKWDQ